MANLRNHIANENTARNLRENDEVGTIGEKISRGLSGLNQDSLENTLERAGENTRELIEKVRTTAEDAYDTARDTIETRPITVVAALFGLGVLVGRLLRR